jgi:hypothetical protein
LVEEQPILTSEPAIRAARFFSFLREQLQRDGAGRIHRSTADRAGAESACRDGKADR